MNGANPVSPTFQISFNSASSPCFHSHHPALAVNITLDIIFAISLLTFLPISCLSNSILHSEARYLKIFKIFLKHKEAHVTSLLETLSWFPDLLIKPKLLPKAWKASCDLICVLLALTHSDAASTAFLSTFLSYTSCPGRALHHRALNLLFPTCSIVSSSLHSFKGAVLSVHTSLVCMKYHPLLSIYFIFFIALNTI